MGTKVSVHKGISGHFEAVTKRSSVAAALDDRRKAKDSAREVPVWGVGGTNSAELRFERESAFSLAKVVSRRASGKRSSEETPAGTDHR